MKQAAKNGFRQVVAIKVHQWLNPWDKVSFDKKARRSRPEPHFYMFTLKASELKALSGIYRRTTERDRRHSSDPNIQRQHEVHRSKRIRDFIHYGYPLSDLSQTKRESPEFNDLQKPGWLPTGGGDILRGSSGTDINHTKGISLSSDQERVSSGRKIVKIIICWPSHKKEPIGIV